MSKLLFVYNAKSDILNSAFDFAHKIISPKTYTCNLCKLTHSNFGEKKEWEEFRKKSSVEMEFLHSNEFEENHERVSYPVVIEIIDNEYKAKISTEELNEINSTEELINALKNKS